MMGMKNKVKRIIAPLLCFAMVAGALLIPVEAKATTSGLYCYVKSADASSEVKTNPDRKKKSPLLNTPIHGPMAPYIRQLKTQMV